MTNPNAASGCGPAFRSRSAGSYRKNFQPWRAGGARIGIKARLPRLLEYLAEQAPDVVCLQELKSSDETFPEADIRAAGYGAVWHGQKAFNGVAVLAKGADPVERQRGLAGDPEDEHSRYLVRLVSIVIVASIYLPNGNPQPGPKFDIKLKWIDRLADARACVAR